MESLNKKKKKKEINPGEGGKREIKGKEIGQVSRSKCKPHFISSHIKCKWLTHSHSVTKLSALISKNRYNDIFMKHA